jgi:hypothetical protein
MRDHAPKTHWEEYSIIDNAKIAQEDVSLIITELHKISGLGDFPFTYGMGYGSLSIKSKNSN